LDEKKDELKDPESEIDEIEIENFKFKLFEKFYYQPTIKNLEEKVSKLKITLKYTNFLYVIGMYLSFSLGLFCSNISLLPG
jgi:hypothetical protein